jgi:hypothetical protein
VVYVTSGLVEVLLDLAADAEPEPVNVVLASSTTDDLTFEGPRPPDLDDDPVLTHFYLPQTGRSVREVFGVDLGTPAGRGRARFLSHPQGPRELTERDDFAAVVLLAVPPWDSLVAFDRSGARIDVDVLDAAPPQETLSDYSM